MTTTQEIIDKARDLTLDEKVVRPEAAARVLQQEFPSLPEVVRDFAQWGLIQRLGTDTHARNQSAAREAFPAVNEPGHLQMAEQATMRVGFQAFLDEYTFVGADGFVIRLGDAQHDDLDCLGNNEAAQATARQAKAEAVFALRDAVGKEQRVRELSDRVLQPLIATLRETAAA